MEDKDILEKIENIISYYAQSDDKEVYDGAMFFKKLLQAYKLDEKVIEEMAKYIEDTADMDSKFGYDICNKENCYADKYILGHCKKCINCIIDYFRKKCE